MTECYRCGNEGHRRNECPQDSPLPPAASAEATAVTPIPPPAQAFVRPASEVCPEDRMHELAAQARAAIGAGNMPPWLRKRMKAWHQVAESRRDPLQTRNY